jgi:hypothetical protein
MIGGDIDRDDARITRVPLSDKARRILVHKLQPLIKDTTIRVSDSRQNSGVGRTQVFGYGNRRNLGFGEFKNNKDYPDLYDALLAFGREVVPDYIPFTAIQVNHNYKTKKHIDQNNIGRSLAISFGDFTGGELVVEGHKYQTKLHPLIFNGALKEHYNMPIKGDRYSLVYFVSAPAKATDEWIENLSKKMRNSARGSGLTSTPYVIGGRIGFQSYSGRFYNH